MAFYDIFNGDADGLCALQQLRLGAPHDATLVTGVKRDIELLRQVQAKTGDELTVLDISLDSNRAALLDLLAAGARCTYFDHHFAGDIPAHGNLAAHIRYVSGTCTSLIVDEYLAGRFRAWAVVGAFGDNLAVEAERAAAPLNLGSAALRQLRELGECLNYNAYGDSVDDLHMPPVALFRKLQPFADPLEFVRSDPTFETLRTGYRNDLAAAEAIAPYLHTATHYAVILPDVPWGRRMHGPWANRLAEESPHRAHAVLTQCGNAYRISVRAPIARPKGADTLCRSFPSGGGRPAAAGINDLPAARLTEFVSRFEAAFG